MLPLSLRDLRVRGEDGRAILSVERFDAAAGAAVGIAGPSGAGKSTLLHAVGGLLRVETGSVRWGETDLAALSEAARDGFRRRSLGLLFQEPLLLEELSPLENAAIAGAFAPSRERAEIRRRAAALLERFGAPTDRASVARLSGGERQRIAAARALAGGPSAILADEPTASLDRASADTLMTDLLRAAREEGRTLLVVSHDPRVLEAMDRVVQVVDGALAPPAAARMSAGVAGAGAAGAL